jgi:nicotinate-nucleotide--dimethylbenzimidazole phosphoribosyltransferase
MLDNRFNTQIQQRIDNKTKPLGALGMLESLALQLAVIQSQGRDSAIDMIEINRPTAIVFAGDHGIADEGVSIAPSAVTQQMVLNFLAGGAGVNCFCRSNQVDIKVVDAGILFPIEGEADNLIVQRLGARTNNFAVEPAMTRAQMEQGLEYGKKVATEIIDSGTNLLIFGEMGIANTSSAAALLSAISGEDAEVCVGVGTGINPEQYQKKVELVRQGVARCDSQDPRVVLAELGGFEIVQIVGGFLAAAELNVPVLVDGFIVTAAAYVATLINPSCRELMIFAHQSQEVGHRMLLNLLDANPLLNLGLRLGEGTGGVLAVSLVRAAAEFYNTMASFDEAGVTI